MMLYLRPNGRLLACLNVLRSIGLLLALLTFNSNMDTSYTPIGTLQYLSGVPQAVPVKS